MSQSVFITGASGFIGGALAAALAPSHQVRALSRSTQSDSAISALCATPVRGDLNSIRPDHIAGCEVVIHCAAWVKQWGSRRQFWSTNVEGTSRVLDAAQQAGVRRFIHIGTEAALFCGDHLRDIDEEHPIPRRTPFLYCETKAAAERTVLAARTKSFETLSVRPRFVWGPGDATILPVLEQMVRAGRFTWIDHGRARTSTTYIGNLVHGVQLAMERGRSGAAYFVTDEGATTMREFLTALLATRGLTPPDASVPGVVARTLGSAAELVWRAARAQGEPPLTRFAASMMSRDCTIRIDKARRELGYEPIYSREQGLAALAQS